MKCPTCGTIINPKFTKEEGFCCDEPDCMAQPHFSTNSKGLPMHCSECSSNCQNCDIMMVDE